MSKPESRVNETRPQPNQLRLLSYNMQLGIRSRHYGDYLAQSWRHLFPPAHPTRHLEPIAAQLQGHDLVALQEADVGSFRTHSINLIHFLAEHAGYPHFEHHNHRRLGRIARHAMGLLSRFPLASFHSHSLPGRVPGRAALFGEIATVDAHGHAAEPVIVIAAHLALGEQDRRSQLSYLQEQVGNARMVVLMGDLNCETDELRRHPFLREHDFLHHPEIAPTFPSWRPKKVLDHILVSADLKILEGGTVNFRWSDHLPVSMTVALPDGLSLAHSHTTAN